MQVWVAILVVLYLKCSVCKECHILMAFYLYLFLVSFQNMQQLHSNWKVNRNKEDKNHDILGYIVNNLDRDVCLHSNQSSSDFYDQNLSLTFYLLQQVAIGLLVICHLVDDCAACLYSTEFHFFFHSLLQNHLGNSIPLYENK